MNPPPPAERRWQRVLTALRLAQGHHLEGRPVRAGPRPDFQHAIQVVHPFAPHHGAGETPATCVSRSLPSSGTGSTRFTSRSRGPELQRAREPGTMAIEPELPTEFLTQVMEAVHQFQGVSDSTMSHGEGWQFIQVGRYIERASATAALLEAYHDDLWAHAEEDELEHIHIEKPEGNEYLDWMGLLRSATAFEAYCKVYTADLTPERILEFLLLDEDFPHSLRFSIDSLQHALGAIQHESGKSRAEPVRRARRPPAGQPELLRRGRDS